MCGITGFCSNSPIEAEHRHILKCMTGRLAHRGPDADDLWTDEHVALGHRRLAILDLTPAGQQPMHSESGRYVLVFNGEIYNHLDMRRQLEDAGCVASWRGTSDTETLLCAIENLGVQSTLEHASGMFALSLYDRKERTLTLARDRIGEKPLYWGWAGNSLIFGSELKALCAHPEFDPAPCQEAATLFLRYNYIPAPWSIYRNVLKLQPGTFLTVELDALGLPAEQCAGTFGDGISLTSYWDPPGPLAMEADECFDSDGEALHAVEEALQGAVARQMLSDVPLGAFLSGGIDSSLIVAMMREAQAGPIRTYTIGFDDPAYDESPHAEAVARHLGTRHSTMQVTEEDARATIPNLANIYDEPFADSSQIPTLLVCRAARQDVAVALSGDGGDEVFGGYNRYIRGPRMWRRFAQMPRSARRALGKTVTALPTSAWDRAGAAYTRLNPGPGGVAQLGRKAHRIGSLLSHADTFESFYKELVSEWRCPSELLTQPVEEPEVINGTAGHGQGGHAAWMMHQDLVSYLPGDVLCKVDRAAMSVSLETRAPFLDPTVIAAAARLRPDQKIRDGAGKWVLRQLLDKHVPRDLIERPKMGFSIPIGAWLRGPLRDWAEELLSPAQLSAYGLRPEPIRGVWQEHLSGRRDNSSRLWGILMLQAWHLTDQAR